MARGPAVDCLRAARLNPNQIQARPSDKLAGLEFICCWAPLDRAGPSS